MRLRGKRINLIVATLLNRALRLQTDIGIPAPTMIFGNNFLVLTYKNSKSPESHEHKFLFDPKAALAGVSKELPDLKVPGASEWVSGRYYFRTNDSIIFMDS